MVKSSCDGGSDCSESAMTTMVMVMAMEFGNVFVFGCMETTAYQDQFLHESRLSSVLVGNNSLDRSGKGCCRMCSERERFERIFKTRNRNSI